MTLFIEIYPVCICVTLLNNTDVLLTHLVFTIWLCREGIDQVWNLGANFAVRMQF